MSPASTNGVDTSTRWAIVPDHIPNSEILNCLNDAYPTYEAAIKAYGSADHWRMRYYERLVRVTASVDHVAFGWDLGLDGDDAEWFSSDPQPIDERLTRPDQPDPDLPPQLRSMLEKLRNIPEAQWGEIDGYLDYQIDRARRSGTSGPR